MSDIVVTPTILKFPNSNHSGRIIRVPTIGRPRFAIFNLIQAETFGSTQNDAHIATGFWAEDGTENCSTLVCGDDGATQSVRTAYLSLSCLGLLGANDTSTTRRLDVIDADIDELVLSYQDSGDFSRVIALVEIWTGNDLSVNVQTVTLTAGVGVEQSVTGVGFEAGLFFAHTAAKASSSSATNHGAFSTGMATWATPTITQRAVTWGPDRGVGTSAMLSRFSDDRILHAQDADSGSANFGVEITSVGSDGCGLTQRTGTVGVETIGLASLNVGDMVINLSTLTTPTSTGSVGYTSLGAKPHYVRVLSTLAETANANEADEDAAHIGIAAWNERDHWHFSCHAEDNVSSTAQERGSLAATQPILAKQGSGDTTRLAASFVSFDATGHTLNWTTVDATARLGAMLQLEEPDPIPNIDRIRSLSRVGRLLDHWDVTNPPKTSLRPASNNHQFTSTDAIHAQLAHLQGKHWMNVVMHFPPGHYIFDTKLLFQGPFEGLRIEGGGRSRDENVADVKQNSTTLEWIGGTTGPGFEFDTTPGLVVQGLRFSAGNVAMDELCRISWTIGGTAQHDLRWDDCLWCANNNNSGVTDGLQSGTPIVLLHQTGGADMMWTNCHWRTNPNEVIHYGSVGVKISGANNVNYSFIQPRFQNLGTCLFGTPAGHLSVVGAILGHIRLFHKMEGASENLAGQYFRNMHVDGGNGTEYRRQLFKNISTQKSVGPVVFDMCNINAANATSDHYKVATVSNNDSAQPRRITFATTLRMNVGDRIQFVSPSDRATQKAEAIIVGIVDLNNTYDVDRNMDTLITSGVDEGTWGDPIFELLGGETLVWQNSQASDNLNIQAGRLCRMASSAGGGFMWVPTFICKDVGLAINGKDAHTLRDRYLTRTGTTQYAFERVGRTSENSSTTFVTRESASNISPYFIELADPPTSANNVAAGYPIGATVKATNAPNRVFYHAENGIWEEITRRSPAPF